jgi:tetratricopeptide (TPR) repeat protein
MRVLFNIRNFLTVVFLLMFLQPAAAQLGHGGFGRRGSQFPPAPAARPAIDSVVLSGTVVQADGSPAPFGAVIEMDCGGEAARMAPVGPDGRFVFHVGGRNDNSQTMPDAGRGFDQTISGLDTMGRTNLSAIGNQAPAWGRGNMLGCEMHALLNSYRSTVLSLSQEPGPGLNEIGRIVVYPYARVQGSTVSLTTLLTPKAARDSFDQAEKEIQKGNLDEAEKFLRLAIVKYPKYAEASFLLGEICERNSSREEARGLYYDAIKADPMYVSPYLRLAKIAASEKRWREAADLSDTALKLDPVSLLECYFINSLAHLNLNDLDVADRRAAEGQRIDFSNQFPQFCLIRASVFAQRKDAAAAVSELRKYLQIAPNAANVSAVRVHIRELEQQAQRVMK